MPRFDPDKLNHALAERQLDGDQLAHLTGLHPSVISRARQGKPIRLNTMVMITAALETASIDRIAAEVVA